jgi:hypothetical protein
MLLAWSSPRRHHGREPRLHVTLGQDTSPVIKREIQL